MAKVVLMLAEGFEEIEGLTVVDLLRRAQVEIHMVSITGNLFVTGSHGIVVKADTLLNEETFDETDMVVLPGGMPGTKYLGEHQEVISLLKEFHEKEKYLAAICAAPSVLGLNGLLEGKRATCFPDFRDKLIGATIIDEKTVVDGKVITSKGMGTAIDFSLELIKVLKGEETAENIGKSIQYL